VWGRDKKEKKREREKEKKKERRREGEKGKKIICATSLFQNLVSFVVKK
jgi:hypothetical protein